MLPVGASTAAAMASKLAGSATLQFWPMPPVIAAAAGAAPCRSATTTLAPFAAKSRQDPGRYPGVILDNGEANASTVAPTVAQTVALPCTLAGASSDALTVAPTVALPGTLAAPWAAPQPLPCPAPWPARMTMTVRSMTGSFTRASPRCKLTRMSGPLDGIRVLDMTSVVVGPICTRTLADQGAAIIKVEAPEGDLLRHMAGIGRNPGMSGKFINFNRNKRSLCVDLRQAVARDAVRALAARADVFVSNIRPDSLARLGLDAAGLCAANPRLIACSILGFGQGGPYAGAPAYDTVIQAAAGVAATFERSLGEPRYVPMVMADHITGLIAAQSIGFALYRREKTGLGEMIEVPMLENMAGFVLTEHLGSATFDPPIGPSGDARLLSPDGKPVRTRDGYISLSANTNAQAFAFFRAIGRPELCDDPRFATAAARTHHTEAYFAIRTAALLARNSAEWLAIFRAADVPAGPYNSIDGLLDDPHLRAVGFVGAEDHPSEGRIRRTRVANVFSGGMRDDTLPAPRLGEHTRAILAEAGCDDAAIAAMLASGAAAQAPPLAGPSADPESGLYPPPPTPASPSPGAHSAPPSPGQAGRQADHRATARDAHGKPGHGE